MENGSSSGGGASVRVWDADGKEKAVLDSVSIAYANGLAVESDGQKTGVRRRAKPAENFNYGIR